MCMRAMVVGYTRAAMVPDLRSDLLDARRRTGRATDDLDGARLLGPKLDIVNPPLWELGHVGWFQEYWCLRRKPSGEHGPSMLAGADALYDSAKVAHDTRWGLPLPDIRATRGYLASVLERVLERLAREPGNEELAYFVRLATFHEDMHAEAFTYTRQTHGYAHDDFPLPEFPDARDLSFARQKHLLGARPGPEFVFDNEKWAHEVEVGPFAIASAPVTNAQYLGYVEAGGAAPRYWKKEAGRWLQRKFDRWLPVEPQEPVIHVSWDEAQAYCRWAKRRLPAETEWECAAAAGMIGPSGVWEWTDSAFLPYPGFVLDPYKEYSEPWFGTHKVLRGGSVAAPARLLRTTFRNFYLPHRGDVFCGFRTCAAG
jgi:iron(II)-dependent oxidoreductase